MSSLPKYMKLKKEPDKNDWSQSIKTDKGQIGLTLSDANIKSLSDKSFKEIVKKELQLLHSKI